MILLIPYTRFTLKTHLLARDVEQRLAAHIEPRRIFRLGISLKHEFFEGKLENYEANKARRYLEEILQVNATDF